MRNPIELWEALGNVGEEEMSHVLTKLFAMYEGLLKQDADNKEALNFMKNLDNAMVLTTECNLNRR